MKYLFGGNSGFLSFVTRTVFEAEHAKDLALMDRKKGTHLRKAMSRYSKECNSTWSCPVLLSVLRFGIFYEYVITRCHINTGNYLLFSYDEKLYSSLGSEGANLSHVWRAKNLVNNLEFQKMLSDT